MTSVEIYTQQYCPYCHWAKELLTRKGVEFREIDVTADRQMRQEMVARANGGTTVPQIFIGATHVGGCDQLYALEEGGKLDALLAEEGKRA
ncbi:MAG: glutaredoxin 3 [Xanthobacteraceae bacterium]|jgi:glutaredoxin 3